MFDPVTRDFLASAPSLPDLPAAKFADELTSAYVEIAAARLALGQPASAAPETLLHLSDRMARIADVLEAQVILGLAGERVRAAAFVAASARQVVFRTSELLIGSRQTRVDEDAISADIAAAILFLIAERTSDAYEVSHLIVEPPPPRVRQLLALSIQNLARGRLARIADLDLRQYRPRTTELSVADAADLLYFRILEGLSLIANDCLGRLSEPALEQAQTLFRQVRDLAVDLQSDGEIPGIERKGGVSSIIPGPHHLAGLLERAAGTFQKAAVVRLPAPEGVREQPWREWLLAEAERQPFIWENHQRAVATGYLDAGHSLVMTSPTGSGKTTLAMLKIASTLCAGKTVIFLAPTHALVSQIENDLNARIGRLARVASIEEALLEEIGQQLPDLAVLTPERCFALLTFAPELFRQVGLLVFDECHLMGATHGGAGSELSFDRRSIDAMLCLLSFVASNKEADYLLLSAMISNGADIAAWLQEVTGRLCIPFDDKWKPTRQLKACVVYEASEFAAVKRSLADDFARRLSPPRSAPATVKAMAKGIPIGLFATGMGWNPEASETLAFRNFATGPLGLGVARRATGWRITANRNEVAAELAARFATSGLKTIVFCENAPTAESVANRVNSSALLVRPMPELNNRQREWRKKALEEVGSDSTLYDAGGRPAAVHHGELLPEERWLVEALFKDRNHNVNVLAATSTLAQGLNLPCDVVILSGTDRIDDSDPEEMRRSDLLAHEILNALGRAGRAGLAASGLAVVVPADPIVCDTESKRLPADQLFDIVFSESDQCLPLTDPIANLYDHIVVHGVAQDEAAYLMKRLALSLGVAREGIETFDDLTRRSFGFFLKARADASSAEGWVSERRHQLERLIEAARDIEPRDWVADLAAKSGASIDFISHLAEAYETAPLASPDACDWMIWLLNQLAPQEQDFDTFLRPDVVGRVLGRAYTRAMGASDRRERARQAVLSVLPGWFGAQPLAIMERTLVEFIQAHEGQVRRATSVHPKAKHARRFALRLAPDLSYLAGVFGQVARKLSEEDEHGRLPLAITQSLPQLVRRGFNSPYHLYLDRRAQGLSRQKIQQQFESISSLIERDPSDDWATVRRKLEITAIKGMFDDNPDTVLDEV